MSAPSNALRERLATAYLAAFDLHPDALADLADRRAAHEIVAAAAVLVEKLDRVLAKTGGRRGVS